jgi:gamma-polyglutamate biosynthesis protein CapA
MLSYDQYKKNEKIKIAAVGDIMLGDNPLCLGFGVKSKSVINGYDYLFEKVKYIFRRNDLAIANLESVIASPMPEEKSNIWSVMNRGLDDASFSLKNCGLGLVSLANNHIFEHGPEALEMTISNLDSAGIIHVGSVGKPCFIFERHEKRIAFLSWSLLPDNYWPGKNPCNYYHVTEKIDAIKDEVALVKGESDYVVLMLHWGFEFFGQPSRNQQEQAHQLIESGVDVILGHHPHVLQPVEEYRGGLIFYSLGNFIFDSWDEKTLSSVIVELEFGNSVDYSFIPVVMSDRNYTPDICTDERRVKAILASLELGDILDDEEHGKKLRVYRNKFRRSVACFVLKNFYRYKFMNMLRLFKWGLARAKYINRIRHSECSDPYIIYRGPMKG